MRILHIDTGREMRGGQYQVKLLLEGLRAAGHDSILLSRPGSPLTRIAAAAGFPVNSVGLGAVWRKSGKADVVHAHDARAHSMAALAAHRPFVVSRRVAFPVGRTFLSKWKYGRAARYLAVSGFVASELGKAGIPLNRIDVVFDAVQTNVLAAGWDAQKPVVAPAFRSDPNKLSELTAEACRVAGSDLLFSNDLARDLPEASAFVYLSTSEGLGSAALLAMAHGVPVIASKVAGLSEVFEHNRSGLYVENSPVEVAACIRRLSNEPGLACRLREAALARVTAQFSPANLVAATVSTYERAIAR